MSETNQYAIPASETRREKHVELQEAIASLDSVTRCLDDLLERIQGPTPRDESGEALKEPQLYLFDVLNGGPSTILEKAEAMHKRITQIAALLF